MNVTFKKAFSILGNKDKSKETSSSPSSSSSSSTKEEQKLSKIPSAALLKAKRRYPEQEKKPVFSPQSQLSAEEQDEVAHNIQMQLLKDQQQKLDEEQQKAQMAKTLKEIQIRATKQDATPLVNINVDLSALLEEDQPQYDLFACPSIPLRAKEGFVFIVDTFPGYFTLKVANTQTARLGIESGLSLLVRVITASSWSQVWQLEKKLGSHSNRTQEIVFSINFSATLQVICLPLSSATSSSSSVLPIGQLSIHLKSCFPLDRVNIREENGVRPSAEIQELWESGETVVRPRFISFAPNTTSNRLAALHSYTATGVGNDVYVFGGCKHDGSFSSTFLLLDSEKHTAGEFGDIFSSHNHSVDRFLYTGMLPSARAGHSACVHAGTICYFGGFSTSCVQSDIHFFVLESRAWVSPDNLRNAKYQNDPALEALPRGYHSAVVYGEWMYIYGGSKNFESSLAYEGRDFSPQPLWRYHFKECRWENLSSRSVNTPHDGGRIYGHSAVVIEGGMYVFGGVSLCKNSKKESAVKSPQRAYSMEAVKFETENSSKGNFCNEVHYLCFDPFVWTVITTTGILPCPRAHAAIWGADTLSSSSNNNGNWPCSLISTKSSKSGKDSSQLQALHIYAGQGKRTTIGAVYVLPLLDFRGHKKYEWFTVRIDDNVLRLRIPQKKKSSHQIKSSNMSDAAESLLKMPKTVLYNLPKAALYDLPKSFVSSSSSAQSHSIHSSSKSSQAALYDIPKAALELAIDNDEMEDSVDPSYPGTFAITMASSSSANIKKSLQLILFGALGCNDGNDSTIFAVGD